MNRKEKQALASLVIEHVGTLVEFWGEKIETAPDSAHLKTIPLDEASQQIANWLGYLPSECWDDRLPEPQKRARKTKAEVQAERAGETVEVEVDVSEPVPPAEVIPDEVAA